MYSAATGSLYSDVHRGVSSLAFGLWGKRWRPPNGTSEGGPTGGSLRPLVWFYFARWIILPGECRPLQQPTFLTHLDSCTTQLWLWFFEKKIRQVGWKKFIPLRFIFGLDRMEKTKPQTHSWNKSKGWQGIGCHVLTKDFFLNFLVFSSKKNPRTFFELFELLNFWTFAFM